MLALVRGDDRLERGEAAPALGSDFRPATEEEIREAFGADPRLARPGRLRGRDRRRRGAAGGAVRRRREPRRLAPARRRARARLPGAFADLRQPREGDACPQCGGALRFQTAIEVGHIFKFGTRYSEPLGATFLDEDGEEKPLIGGSYGIGPGRVMAAVVEQQHDEHGISWPASIAPYDVHVRRAAGRSRSRREEAAQASTDAGLASCSTTATSAPARSSPTPT